MQAKISMSIYGATLFLKIKRTRTTNYTKYVTCEICTSEMYHSEYLTLHVITKNTISISVPIINDES